jgi:hypothetical protein
MASAHLQWLEVPSLMLDSFGSAPSDLFTSLRMFATVSHSYGPMPYFLASATFVRMFPDTAWRMLVAPLWQFMPLLNDVTTILATLCLSTCSNVCLATSAGWQTRRAEYATSLRREGSSAALLISLCSRELLFTLTSGKSALSISCRTMFSSKPC